MWVGAAAALGTGAVRGTRMNARGQQLDLFAPADADSALGVIALAHVLPGMAAHPVCGCRQGYVRRVEPHVGLYCSAHGQWLCWLDADGRECARRANETKEKESSEVIHGHQ